MRLARLVIPRIAPLLTAVPENRLAPLELGAPVSKMFPLVAVMIIATLKANGAPLRPEPA